jgi:hypothetical protein
MYTIGAFRKKNNVNEEVKIEEVPSFVDEWPSLVDESTKNEQVVPQSDKKDWIILTKNNITDDEKPEDIKKNELLRVIRYNDREVILKKAYLEYIRENEDYMRNIYDKITTMNPFYFDKLRSSERGFLVFSRFIFSKYIFDKNNLKQSRNL